jgi:hypothetical protein
MRHLTPVLLLLALAAPAAAGDFDGSKRLVCVPQEALECEPSEPCMRVTPDELGIPNFLEVDFKAKVLRDDTGATRETTAIQNVAKVDGKTILQGAQRGRAWSIVIDQGTGHMSAAVSGVDDDGERFGFTLFGVCKKD